MNKQEILSHIDHTLLKPDSTWEEICALCDEAVEMKTADVCVPPSYIERVHEKYPDLNICAAVGFPLGYNTKETKVFEAEDAVRKGANEIDMVIDIGALKDGDDDFVLDEIKAVKNAIGDHILKVIAETCYLSQDEKKRICQIVTEAGADYIKTSTGFGTGGATREDVTLFKENTGENVKIKAAGGIRTKEDIVDFIEMGCDRIGTSSIVSALNAET